MARNGVVSIGTALLVTQAAARHKREMSDAPPRIFDSRRRLALRARAQAMGAEDAFLLQHMADELAERLSCVSRRFESILLIGPIALLADKIALGLSAGRSSATITGNVMLDEEFFPYPPHSFDLVVSAGTLDSVNDLPGALIQIRSLLKPDGLFLGTVFGAGSLHTLKSTLISADGAAVRPHIHPQIDVRTMADLLARAGFALPVADVDALKLRYSDWKQLVADLRAAGAGNALAGPRPFHRMMPQGMDAAWETLREPDGKVSERINFVQLSGWAPSPDQQKPAKRGSGQISLATLLGQS